MRLTAAVLVSYFLILFDAGWFILPMAVVLAYGGSVVTTLCALCSSLVLAGSNVPTSPKLRAAMAAAGLAGLLFAWAQMLSAWAQMPGARHSMEFSWMTSTPFFVFVLWHVIHLAACLRE